MVKHAVKEADRRGIGLNTRKMSHAACVREERTTTHQLCSSTCDDDPVAYCRFPGDTHTLERRFYFTNNANSRYAEAGVFLSFLLLRLVFFFFSG